MNNTFTLFSTAILRKMFMLGTIAIAMSLTGCAAVAPKYQATVDNAKTLQATQGGVASVGQFTAKNASLNQLSLRGGAYTSPYNNSYADYLKEALRVELESAGKLGNNTNVIITGELLKTRWMQLLVQEQPTSVLVLSLPEIRISHMIKFSARIPNGNLLLSELLLFPQHDNITLMQ